MRRIKPGVRGRLGWAIRLRRHPRYVPGRSVVGRTRLLWHDFIFHPLFEGGERCQDCGRDYVLWHAPTDLYERVHGSTAGLLCPKCFSRQADEAGIPVEFIAARAVSGEDR